MDGIVTGLSGRDGNGLVGRGGLGRSLGFGAGSILHVRDVQDLVGLQAFGLKLQGGVGVIDVLDSYAVRLGYREQRLALKNHVRIVQLAVFPDLVPGNGHGSGLVFGVLRMDRTRSEEQYRSKAGHEKLFHNFVLFNDPAKSVRSSANFAQLRRFFSSRMCSTQYFRMAPLLK